MQYRDNFKDKLYVVLMFVSYISSLVFTGERCTFQLFFLFLVLIVLEQKLRSIDFFIAIKNRYCLLKTV